MLNLQFAETMELTEAELQDVRGGNLVNSMGGGGRSGISGWGVPGIYTGWGNQGMSPNRGAFDWTIDLADGLFGRRRR